MSIYFHKTDLVSNLIFLAGFAAQNIENFLNNDWLMLRIIGTKCQLIIYDHIPDFKAAKEVKWLFFDNSF